VNKTEYMSALEKRLRILPKENYNEAMAYFEEYFEDAGPEREQQAIEDLGSPDTAAEQIITNMAIQKASVPQKGLRKNMNALWIGILAVCAVPIALPFAVLFLGVIVLLILCVLLVLAAFIMAALAFVVCGPIAVAASFTVLFSAPATALSCFGAGLFCTGLGLLAVYGVLKLCRLILISLVKLFGNILKMKGERHA
jgi:uncharacterized membrane protein